MTPWKVIQSHFTYEPPHDKTNKVSVHPVKTQISLGIRPVWSASSLSAWRKFRSLATYLAHSKDSDQTGRMPRLIWVCTGRTCHFVGFVTILKTNDWLRISCYCSAHVSKYSVKFPRAVTFWLPHPQSIPAAWYMYKTPSKINFVCLFWGFTAQSTLLSSRQAGQLTNPHFLGRLP